MNRFRKFSDQFTEIEDVVFRSGLYKPYLSGAIDYQMTLWQKNMKSLSYWDKIIHRSQIKSINIRALSVLAYIRTNKEKDRKG